MRPQAGVVHKSGVSFHVGRIRVKVVAVLLVALDELKVVDAVLVLVAVEV